MQTKFDLSPVSPERSEGQRALQFFPKEILNRARPKTVSKEESIQTKKPTGQRPNSFISTNNVAPKCFRKKSQKFLNKHTQNQKEKINIKDYDIFCIDKKIKSILIDKITTIPQLMKELENFLWIQKHNQNYIDQIKAKEEIKILRRRIRDLENTLELGFYIIRTHSIVKKYTHLNNLSSKISFIPYKQKKQKVSQQKQKQNLINQYLRVAQEYLDIENTNYKTPYIRCQACGNSTDFKCDGDVIYICLKCGVEIEVVDDSPTFRDTDRINLCFKYTYTKRGHFIDAIKRYQGKQNTTISKEIFDIIEQEMEYHNLTKNEVSIDNIYEFLYSSRLPNKHYEDIYLIHSIITKKPCRDISHLEPKLLEMFDAYEEVYNKLKDPKRTNSQNVNFKLLMFLSLLGVQVKKSQFYILKTQNAWSNHQEKYEQIRKVLGWKFSAVL